jgi:hypothetical protein
MLRRLHPYVILLQEMMWKGEEVIKVISPWLKYLAFIVVDAKVLSDGIPRGWSSAFKTLSTSSLISTIYVKLKHKDVDFSISVINIYDPYSDIIPFWEDLKDEGIFNDPFTSSEGI